MALLKSMISEILPNDMTHDTTEECTEKLTDGQLNRYGRTNITVPAYDTEISNTVHD